MQILPPMPQRARLRLHGLAGLVEDRTAAKRSYDALYRTEVLPLVGGGSIPPAGLKDEDLPVGIKYLAPDYIASKVNDLTRKPLVVSGDAMMLRDSPAEGLDLSSVLGDKLYSDSTVFAGWLALRLGGYLRGGYIDPQRLRGYLTNADFLKLSKDTLAEWVGQPPNWGPWNSWQNDGAAPAALALLWAKKLIAQRYGYTVPFFYEYKASQRGKEIAAGLKKSLVNDVATSCATAAGGVTTIASLSSSILVGATVGGPAGAIAGAAVGYFSGQAGKGVCSEEAQEAKDDLEANFRDYASSEELATFIALVYSGAFGVFPASVSEETIADIDARTQDIRSASGLAVAISEPQFSPTLLAAEQKARAGVLSDVKQTFMQTVGCPITKTYAARLTDTYFDGAWTSQDSVKSFLLNRTPETVAIAQGKYCDRLLGTAQRTESGDLVADPKGTPKQTTPKDAYIRAILGEEGVSAAHPPAPANDGWTPPQDETPPESKPVSPMVWAALGLGAVLLLTRKR